MYDASESESEMYGEEVAMPSKGGKSTKKYYPHLDFDSKQFPEISNMKVGKECMLLVKVKPTRFSINEKEGTEAKSEMCFDVLEVGMSDDQNESSDEKTNKMVDKMYPPKTEKKQEVEHDQILDY